MLLQTRQSRDQQSSGGSDAAEIGHDSKGWESWEDVRRIAEALGPRIRTASRDVRDRWQTLQPRLAEIERLCGRPGESARQIVRRKLATAAAMLLRLRDDVVYAAG